MSYRHEFREQEILNLFCQLVERSRSVEFQLLQNHVCRSPDVFSQEAGRVFG
jgi:hypothetical protein